jgi:hypothetical protein
VAVAVAAGVAVAVAAGVAVAVAAGVAVAVAAGVAVAVAAGVAVGAGVGVAVGAGVAVAVAAGVAVAVGAGVGAGVLVGAGVGAGVRVGAGVGAGVGGGVALGATAKMVVAIGSTDSARILALFGPTATTPTTWSPLVEAGIAMVVLKAPRRSTFTVFRPAGLPSQVNCSRRRPGKPVPWTATDTPAGPVFGSTDSTGMPSAATMPAVKGMISETAMTTAKPVAIRVDQREGFGLGLGLASETQRVPFQKANVSSIRRPG